MDWFRFDSGGGCHGAGSRVGSDEANTRAPQRDSKGESSNEPADIADSALRKAASGAKAEMLGDVERVDCGRALHCSLADIYYSLTFRGSYRYFDYFFSFFLSLGYWALADVF